MNDIVQDILDKSNEQAQSILVEKNLELNFDLGTLLAIDNNELDKKQLRNNQEKYLKQLTRDNTQLLVNALWELPNERIDDVICAKLPPQTTVLPRSQKIPKQKELTKWEQFAKDKGIQKKKKSKLTWDETLKKWIPNYGYRKAAAQREKDWLLEVPDNADPKEDMFLKKKTEKGEKIAKNELLRLRNIAKKKGVKLPRVGIPSAEQLNAKQLNIAATVAKASTASLGKFQPKLSKEKEARGIGVAEITPGANPRKRKGLKQISGIEEKKQNLSIVDNIFKKKPILNMEKATNIHISNKEQQRSEEKQNRGKKSKKSMKKANFKNKKSNTIKGQKKVNKNSGGRKRR